MILATTIVKMILAMHFLIIIACQKRMTSHEEEVLQLLEIDYFIKGTNDALIANIIPHNSRTGGYGPFLLSALFTFKMLTS